MINLIALAIAPIQPAISVEPFDALLGISGDGTALAVWVVEPARPAR